jgi:hypothetical protein
MLESRNGAADYGEAGLFKLAYNIIGNFRFDLILGIIIIVDTPERIIKFFSKYLETASDAIPLPPVAIPLYKLVKSVAAVCGGQFGGHLTGSAMRSGILSDFPTIPIFRKLDYNPLPVPITIAVAPHIGRVEI